MTTILNEGVKKIGMGLHLVKYGYQEAPETTLLMYDMESLNQDNLDFRNLKLKNVAQQSTITESGESIEWREEDMKEAYLTIVTVTSPTSIVVNTTGVAVGEILYEQTTQETAVVVAVNGTTITLDSPGFATIASPTNVGDKITRQSFTKKYGVDNGNNKGRNDLTPYTNYIQFVEYQIASDLIENNKTYLRTTPDQRNQTIFGDQSRKIIKGAISDYYTGKKFKTNTTGDYQYGAGGLNEFIPSGAKINIKGSDYAATKANLRLQLQKAYQCGLAGVYGNNKVLFFCTTKWAADIDALYEDKVQYNDSLKGVNIQIATYNVGGFKMNMVVSGLLDYHLGDVSMAYVVPVDYTFMHMLPRAAVEADGKATQVFGRGIVYKKPQTTIEKSTIALATNYSFMFQGVGSGAFRKLTIA